MRKQQVAAIVVTYNRKKLLKECIKSLLEQTTKPDIYIIDNNSTDGTVNYIAKYIDDNSINYVNTGKNLGGAGGFQYGIKMVAQKDYYFVWIMDDDCIPTKNALNEFLKADIKLNHDYGFLSSKTLWTDNTLCTMNIQRRTLTKNVSDFSSELIPVTLASFVSLFVPVSVIKKVGLPIKEFFIWTDDWEYTRRISSKYECYVVTNSIVVHKTKTNVGANIATDVPERIERYRYLYRNDFFFYRKEGLKGYGYEFLRLNDHMIRVLFKAKNNKRKRLKMIFKGTIEGLRFNPSIEYIK